MNEKNLSSLNRALIERVFGEEIGPLEGCDRVELSLSALNRLLDAARAEGRGIGHGVVAGQGGGGGLGGVYGGCGGVAHDRR